MTKPVLIALYAPAMGSGKSEVAKVLIEEYGAVLLKFAGPLKDMTRALLPHLGVEAENVERCVEGDLKEAVIPMMAHHGLTPRRIMQTIGTEWREHIATTLWTDISEGLIRKHLEAGRNVVIDDLRFPHEVDTIERFGGFMVRVDCPWAKVSSQHASEGQLSRFQFDYAINNNERGIDRLQGKVREMMKVISQ